MRQSIRGGARLWRQRDNAGTAVVISRTAILLTTSPHGRSTVRPTAYLKTGRFPNGAVITLPGLT